MAYDYSFGTLTHWFGGLMCMSLEKEEAAGKFGWEKMSDVEVLRRIRDEMKELQEALETGATLAANTKRRDENG
jgi:hypothetical protein